MRDQAERAAAGPRVLLRRLRELMADPLGPLVKVLPSIVLALAALAIYEER